MTNETSRFSDDKDIAGTIGALIFIGVGAAAWWGTESIARVDAYVFPRAIIIIMVSLSVCLIIYNMLTHSVSSDKQPPGSVLRRVILVIALLLASYFMEDVGFIIAMIPTYIVLMFTAMYERWTWFRAIVYPLSGIVVVFTFYYLFAVIFNIPLPEAPWR